ncbi:LuxR C-terminal-related transcriptional regulator [Mycolicibacterium vaccae]|uniref:LuxR C-terminal-related transcriptional regulator n=1 Tax=Mycolicibacterium vaccae TaxID=1810 RepID=UPI003D07C600
MLVQPQTDLISTARAAHGRGDWHASYEAFDLAGRVSPLGTDDLDAFSFAAWRLGHIRESSRAAERVYAELTRTDPVAAAMKANELALAWLVRGDVNIAQGWMSRSRRLLTGLEDSPAHGYLAYLDAAVAVGTGDFDGLGRHVVRLQQLAEAVDTPAVTALGLIAAGIDEIVHARTAQGYALIDEAMLSLMADQVPIEWAGDLYCTVLHHCHKLADFPRLRSWTQSMEQWCGLAGSAPYGGVCDVHRLQARSGTDDYRGLESRLAAASQALQDVNGWAAAEGFYELGEVRRLMGDFDGAAIAFGQSRALGMDPQPGEALLVCRRDPVGAWTAIRLALAGGDRLARVRLLRAAVQIALTRDALAEAESYCAELEAAAEDFGTPGFLAWAAHSRGALLVRQGAYRQALESLERALGGYRVQQSRYDTAEVYEWMVLARRGIGQNDAAAADAATADAIYAQLGVDPAGICGSPGSSRLTRRECEVLACIARGATNRQAAQQLSLSEKTVGRHLANIYAKIGVSSRTAAAAWARDNNVL